LAKASWLDIAATSSNGAANITERIVMGKAPQGVMFHFEHHSVNFYSLLYQ
jgi:hypothetical protein